MYYIKNGLGSHLQFLAVLFCFLGAFAAIGTGCMTQINTIASSINTTIASFGVNIPTFIMLDQSIPFTSLVIGGIVAVISGLVLFGGIKRIGRVTEKLVPIMACVYVLVGIIVVI